MLRYLLFYTLLLLLAASCGTTYVKLGDGAPEYDIYNNGKYIGTGQGKIQRCGPPVQRTITVLDYNGIEVARKEIRRKITVGTVVFAFLPYPTYLSLLFNWKYDREIVIGVEKSTKTKVNNWDGEPNKASAWD